MRAFSLKSLCLLAGFVVPCLGTSSQAEAGVIPWLYNSIFGYGWGHNYGGYGGGVPYSVGYGSMGYGSGYGYSAASYPTYAPAYSNFGYGAAPSSCGCSTGISSAPMMSAPNYSTPTPANSTPSNSTPGSDEPPTEPTKTYYQPSAGYYDYYTGYTPAYVVDSGSCCVPCTSCGGGDCATTPSVKSAKPETQPTPAGPDKKDPKEDDFKGTQEGAGKGTGANTGSGYSPGEANDVLPNKLPVNENTPARRPGPAGEVGTDSGELEPPVKDDSSPDEGLREQGGAAPSDRSIAVRYNPTLKRSPIAIPSSVARIVRAERTSRTVMAVKPETHSQVAVKP